MRPKVLTRAFARHYVEMVLVMLAGMAALYVPARLATNALWPDVPGDDATLMLTRMGVAMTLPMVPWMRWRGHAWQPCMEMAAAMLAPVVGVLALEVLGGVTDAGLLMALEHLVMFAAMFAVMVARPREYSHGRCRPAEEPAGA